MEIDEIRRRHNKARDRLANAAEDGRSFDAARRASLRWKKILADAEKQQREEQAAREQAAIIELGKLAAQELVGLPEIAKAWAAHLQRTLSSEALEVLRSQPWFQTGDDA